MYYIQPSPNPGGGYPAPQSVPAPGLLSFPDEFLPVFYPEGKEAAGFVTIQHDGETVTDCQWNEEAYQAWLSIRPEPEEPEPAPPSLEDRITALEAENAALTAAIERGMSL